MQRLIVVISLLIFIVSPSLSQTDSIIVEENFKVKKAKKTAYKQIKWGNVYAASDLLEKVLIKSPDDVEAAYRLAEAYYKARDYKKAQKWYGMVSDRDPVTYPMAQYNFGLMLKYNGEYESAKTQFLAVKKSYKGEDSRIVKKWADIEAKGCDLASKLKENPLPVNITHLNENVNSHYTDVAPLMWNDTTLLFATLPTDTVIVIDDKANPPDYFIKLYSSILKNGDYQKAEIFDRFNEMGQHIANGSFSYDKKRFYFNKCVEDKKLKITCGIYVSELIDGIWGDPYKLSSEINAPGTTSTQPYLAPYKRGEVLYFVSDREGGKGGLDIWYSTITSRGEYKTPRNCGTKINTNRDEATPYYDRGTGTLFFSSNGHLNIGGYDIYKTKGELSRWSKTPENLGYPINSSTDDMYYRLKDNSSGFIVSNRPGILSIRSETCCDDIFEFEYYDVIRVAVKGFVYDIEDTTKTPLSGAKVSLYLQNFGGLDSDILVNDDNSEPDKPYFFELNRENEYKVSGEVEGYLTRSSEFSTKGIIESDTLHVDIYLTKYVEGKAYRLKNIYYDFDKWNLREESKYTLDTLYNIMVENPAIIGEIGSHTDARASASYNLRLSQKRAESCVNYLIEKGIQKNRLVAKGYGETHHLDDCTKYEDCPEDNSSDCPCHQLNRRTEFKVIGELDADLIYQDERYDDE